MIVVGFVIGVILLVIAAGLWNALKRRQPLDTRDENLLLATFALAYVGSWLFLAFGLVWLRGQGLLPIGLNLVTGGVLGLVPGILGLTHWFLQPMRLASKETPEETMGGGCIGVAVLLGSVVLGAIIGLIAGGFWG
jgi:hypothetical protein